MAYEINTERVLSRHLMLFLIISIIIVPFISADYYERDIFIVDKDGNTQYKYQIIGTVWSSDYYIPGQQAPVIVPENVTNLRFFNNNGETNASLVSQENGSIIYTLYMTRVESNQPSQAGYMYDLPEYTTTRFNENYFLNYPYYYYPDDSEREIFICIANTASPSPQSYDSSLEEVNPFEIEKLEEEISVPPHIYVSPDYFAAAAINPCPNGYKKNSVSEIRKGVITPLKFYFKDTSNRIETYEQTHDYVSVTAPIIYQDFIESNIPLIEKTIPDISKKLNLKTPSKYDLRFIGDNDEAFGLKNDFISHYGGIVQYKVSMIQGGDEFFQLNVLRGIIGSSIIDTYEYGYDLQDSWWSLGVSTNLAYLLMKENNLSTVEIKKSIDLVKEEIQGLSNEEVKEMIKNENDDGLLLIYSSIVDDIDLICENHALKLNNLTKGLGAVNITGERELNNFLIYGILEVCSKDISENLDKYGLDHDEVLSVVNRYNRYREQFNSLGLDSNEIIVIKTIKSDLSRIESYLKAGNIEDSTRLLDDSENIYESKLKPLLIIMQEYSSAEKESASIPAIFYLPSKIIVNYHLNNAAKHINLDNLDLGKIEIDKSLYWCKNIIISTIVFYLIIILLLLGTIFTYKRLNQKKFKKKH